MRDADTAEIFWCYSVLFLKIVDARYELWMNDVQHQMEPSQKFEQTIQRQIKRRVDKWQDLRNQETFLELMHQHQYLLRLNSSYLVSKNFATPWYFIALYVSL